MNIKNNKFQEQKNFLTNFNKELSKYKENFNKEILEFEKVEKSFNIKTEDFFDEERRLRLAVIGQVKAGKSTFLNNLLFDGEEILPKAATPKTATLTVIKYDKTNRIEIEFYSTYEWKDLLSLSKIDGESDEIKVAKEIMSMLKNRNIDFNEYIGQEPLVKEYPSYEELLGQLNEYAGENGKLTPLVKSLTLYVNEPSIKDIEIIDTPGLNDPIVSRTIKTREYIEKCDVVFFLSQSSSFLDSTDMELLGSQLPQKGINKMILLASKYDSAITDVIWNLDSTSEAEVEVKTSLKRVAKRNFEKYIESFKKRNQNSDMMVKVMEDGKNPIFISSMTYNMSKKSVEEFNAEEMTIYEGLCEHEEPTSTDLKRLGNFEEVRGEYEEVIKKKEIILEEKARDFLPKLKLEFNIKLNEMKSRISKRIEILQKNDIEELKKENQNLIAKKNQISLDTETAFGKLKVNLEREKSDAIMSMRELIKEYSSVDERTGTELKATSREVSTSKWYNPFSWGSTETIQSSYTETYSYLDAADTAENLRNYANDSANTIEKVFNKAMDFSSTKKQLLTAIVNNFDTSSDVFDPAYFKLMIERTLNDIEIPVIEIDIQKQLQSIVGKFTGEIRDSSKKVELKMELSKAITDVFKALSIELTNEVSVFKDKIKILKSQLTEVLISDISSELETIISQFEDREKEIELNKELEKLIVKYL